MKLELLYYTNANVYNTIDMDLESVLRRMEPTPQDIEWYKEYVNERLGQISETFERVKY
jgi:hypothetical protein